MCGTIQGVAGNSRNTFANLKLGGVAAIAIIDGLIVIILEVGAPGQTLYDVESGLSDKLHTLVNCFAWVFVNHRNRIVCIVASSEMPFSDMSILGILRVEADGSGRVGKVHGIKHRTAFVLHRNILVLGIHCIDAY